MITQEGTNPGPRTIPNRGRRRRRRRRGLLRSDAAMVKVERGQNMVKTSVGQNMVKTRSKYGHTVKIWSKRPSGGRDHRRVGRLRRVKRGSTRGPLSLSLSLSEGQKRIRPKRVQRGSKEGQKRVERGSTRGPNGIERGSKGWSKRAQNVAQRWPKDGQKLIKSWSRHGQKLVERGPCPCGAGRPAAWTLRELVKMTEWSKSGASRRGGSSGTSTAAR